MEVGDVAILFTAASSTAAAVSAWSSRQAVTRSNAPFVWPAISIHTDPAGRHVVGVRLHNDGPGVAFDVRFALGGPDDDYGDTYSIPPVRAMRPGERVPPHPEPQEQPIRNGLFEYALPGRLGQEWWVIVRYSDGLGRQWEGRFPLDPSGRVGSPTRLRSGRLDRWRRRAGW